MALGEQNSPDTAGVSAQREFERRHANRRQRAKARYGALGTLFASVTADPVTIQGWQHGAGGELATARELGWRLRRSDVIVLHDRGIPGRGRANIDHLAIGPGGVTVIDTKSSRGQVQVTSRGMFHRREVLLVNGRDRTRQLDAVERQINTVANRLSGHAPEEIWVLGALCYPYMHRPFLHYHHARDGLITVDDPRHIAKLANRPGSLTPGQIEEVAEKLATIFPSAT